jgi:hypothetical protein
MPKPATDLAFDFDNHIATLEDTRIKMERLLVSGHINRDDIEQVYRGLYLDLFGAFERLLEELFFGLLAGDVTSTLPGVIPKVDVSSAPFVRDVLLIGKNYLDWMPYERTLEKAETLFDNGEPFTLLADREKGHLRRFLSIRNAIAHQSDYAQQRFEKQVLPHGTLSPRERTPAGFLRSIFRRPSQIQYELVIQELQGISRILCQ